MKWFIIARDEGLEIIITGDMTDDGVIRRINDLLDNYALDDLLIIKGEEYKFIPPHNEGRLVKK